MVDYTKYHIRPYPPLDQAMAPSAYPNRPRPLPLVAFHFPSDYTTILPSVLLPFSLHPPSILLILCCPQPYCHHPTCLPSALAVPVTLKLALMALLLYIFVVIIVVVD